MYNEDAVAERVIRAAAALQWPSDRLEIQVLDDSTHPATRALVEQVCADVRREQGADCRVVRRTGRAGYKAGALEHGRRLTSAELIAVFDADFVPPPDFLVRTVAHFYDRQGRSLDDLALVQARWGHLNADESPLTRAQSLWVDDHHTLQMSWRAARWDFINFTGTAGIWRAAAIERAGGWRALSLVEDCELSFRHLFTGYRTTFVKEIVAPSELPATVTSYKAQQRRWTQGWAQLQRLHLATLWRHPVSTGRHLHLLYHMCIPWQWPAWALWVVTLPALIQTGLWAGALGPTAGAVVYLVPAIVWALVVTIAASFETRRLDAGARRCRALLDVAGRSRRIAPYWLLNTGMLPHQFSAFCEGMFGPLASEFERTPKAASVTSRAGRAAEPAGAVRARVKVHRPYVGAEVFFVALQLGWTLVFLRDGLVLCALGATYLALCVAGLVMFYGDDHGRWCFVFERRRRTQQR
jgi:hypothetical protein